MLKAKKLGKDRQFLRKFVDYCNWFLLIRIKYLLSKNIGRGALPWCIIWLFILKTVDENFHIFTGVARDSNLTLLVSFDMLVTASIKLKILFSLFQPLQSMSRSIFASHHRFFFNVPTWVETRVGCYSRHHFIHWLSLWLMILSKSNHEHLRWKENICKWFWYTFFKIKWNKK